MDLNAAHGDAMRRRKLDKFGPCGSGRQSAQPMKDRPQRPRVDRHTRKLRRISSADDRSAHRGGNPFGRQPNLRRHVSHLHDAGVRSPPAQQLAREKETEQEYA